MIIFSHFFHLRAQQTSIPSTKGTDRQYEDLLAFYRKTDLLVDDGTVNTEFNSTTTIITSSKIVMVNIIYPRPFSISQWKTKRTYIGTTKKVRLATTGVTELIGCL